MRTFTLTSLVIVLMDRNGNIQHFYKRDQEEYFQKRAMEERQAKDLSKDPESDTYAVQATWHLCTLPYTVLPEVLANHLVARGSESRSKTRWRSES
jgi:hypothetical protein